MLEIGTSGLMSGEEKRVIIRLTSAVDTALLLDSTEFVETDEAKRVERRQIR